MSKRESLNRQETDRTSNTSTTKESIGSYQPSFKVKASSTTEPTIDETTLSSLSKNEYKNSTMITCSASAPGKVILFGEHAVVYNQPAIAASLSNLRIQTTVQTRTDGLAVINMPDMNNLYVELTDAQRLICKTCHTVQDIRHYLEMKVDTVDLENKTAYMALVPLLYLIQSIVPVVLSQDMGVSVHVSSGNLPVGAGLGSSAAFSVSASAALVMLVKALNNNESSTDLLGSFSQGEMELINQYAFLSEQCIHGSPSGIDNTISCFGGAMLFQRNFEKNVSEPRITHIANFPSLDMVLTHTNVPRSTKILVSHVRDKYDSFPHVVEHIVEGIGAISRVFFEECGKHKMSFERLSNLVQMNQLLLQALGVSHSSIEQICALTKKYNVFSKLTGAGGGGCVVSFLPNPECGVELKRAVERELNLKCWTTKIGGDGVRVESVSEDNMKIMMKRTRKNEIWFRWHMLGYGFAMLIGIGSVWNFRRKN